MEHAGNNDGIRLRQHPSERFFPENALAVFKIEKIALIFNFQWKSIFPKEKAMLIRSHTHVHEIDIIRGEFITMNNMNDCIRMAALLFVHFVFDLVRHAYISVYHSDPVKATTISNPRQCSRKTLTQSPVTCYIFKATPHNAARAKSGF